MTEEKISVVIPAYNSAETIEAAVDSALSQSVPVEVIIIDDCSDDNLEQVLERYKADGRVTVFVNPENIGVAASRNRGVGLASGEYVAFLDSDDMWEPDKLERQLERLKETGAVLCSTARELINEDGSRTGRVIEVPEKVTYKLLLRGNVINCSSVLIRREIALEFPMGDDDIHEDYICWLRILKKYGSSVAINKPLLLYRQMRNSKSGSKLTSARMTFQVYRKMGFGFLKSCGYFICYAVNGILKYAVK